MNQTTAQWKYKLKTFYFASLLTNTALGLQLTWSTSQRVLYWNSSQSIWTPKLPPNLLSCWPHWQPLGRISPQYPFEDRLTYQVCQEGAWKSPQLVHHGFNHSCYHDSIKPVHWCHHSLEIKVLPSWEVCLPQTCIPIKMGQGPGSSKVQALRLCIGGHQAYDWVSETFWCGHQASECLIIPEVLWCYSSLWVADGEAWCSKSLPDFLLFEYQRT